MSNGPELPWSGVLDAVQKIEDYTSMSLFQYTKRATINSRVYISRNLANEEILTPLMLSTMNLYTGLIMTAMAMNRQISDTHTVRDAMSIVATESFEQKKPAVYSSDLMDSFFGRKLEKPSTEESINTVETIDKQTDKIDEQTDKIEEDTIEDSATADVVDEANAKMSRKMALDDIWDSFDYDNNVNMGKGGVIEPETKSVRLPSGRIIQINFGSAGDSRSNNFTLNLLLQLSPQFIPESVAAQFINLNFTPSIKQRWMQVSAGEISFIKDFLMGLDQRKARRKALKQDKSGVLRDMIERQENNLSSSWLKLLFVQPDRQNIANTILIFDKNTFDRATSMAGLRFKNYNSRQKFFSKTFSMMIHVVDPMYNKVTTYYHGLDAISEFTFEQIKTNSKTENVDLMQVMKAYAQGMAPKF